MASLRGLSGNTFDTRGGTLKANLTSYIKSVMLQKDNFNIGLLANTSTQNASVDVNPGSSTFDQDLEANVFIVGISRVEGPDVCGR